jgi:hypothetical protein
MPSTNDYYLQLKTQLDTAALAKKAALDAALERATNAEFGADGTITKQGTGVLDVNFQNDKRTLGTNAESSGTLRSGQYGRKLTENETGYRAKVAEAKGTTTAAKGEVDTNTASQLAQYQAMYYTPQAKTTTPKSNNPKTGASAQGTNSSKIETGTSPLPIGLDVFTPGKSAVVAPKPKALKPVNSNKPNVVFSPSVVAQYQRAYGSRR